jgi:endonuclease G
MFRILACIVACTWAAASAAHADAYSDCAKHLPYGAPSMSQHVTAVCYEGYITAIDDDALVPRWTAYRLTPEHALGCLGRTNNFHEDKALPADHRAKLADYTGSGYDRGHMSPADDFGYDIDAMKASFSLANMAPQLKGLNEQGWERLEETVRTWVWARGHDFIIYTGSVLSKHPKTIGNDKVAVPSKFWKVVVDTKTHDVLAFEMEQKPVKKGPLGPYQKTLAQVFADAGFRLPLPADTSVTTKHALWPADLSGRKAAEDAKCH